MHSTAPAGIAGAVLYNTHAPMPPLNPGKPYLLSLFVSKMRRMALDDLTQVLDRFLDPVLRSLTPESAKRLLDVRANASDQMRMDELADRCNEGLLTSDERSEYEAYVAAASLIAALQARARATLSGGAAA
jgi:hypothetical protein